MVSRSLLSLILFLVTSGLDGATNAVAQSKTESILSLDDAIEQATNNNPILGAFREASLSSAADIEPQAALEDPVLSFELSDYPLSSLDPSESGSAGNRFTLKQKFPFPGQRTALRHAAAEAHQASEQNVETKRLELISEVKGLYAELVFAHASLNLVESQLQLLQNTLVVARNNFAFGKIPQSDVLTLQVESATLLDRQIQIKSNIESTRSEINQLLGRDDNRPWQPAKLPPLQDSLAKLSAEDLLTRIASINPTIKTYEATLRSATAMEDYSKLKLYPDLEVMAGYNARFPNDDDGGDDEISIGVGITIPLWRNSKQQKLIEKAAADKRRSARLLRDAHNALAQELHRVVIKLRESIERVLLAQNALLPLSRSAVAAADKAYAAGETTLSAVLTLMRSRFESELTYQESVTQQYKNVAALEKLLGGPEQLAQLAKSARSVQ